MIALGLLVAYAAGTSCVVVRDAPCVVLVLSRVVVVSLTAMRCGAIVRAAFRLVPTVIPLVVLVGAVIVVSDDVNDVKRMVCWKTDLTDFSPCSQA